MPSINGMAHVQLSVSDMRRSTPFYERLLHALDMKTIVKSPAFFYCVGGRTGVAISPADPELAKQGHQQRRPGLHHHAKTPSDIGIRYEMGDRSKAMIAMLRPTRTALKMNTAATR